MKKFLVLLIVLAMSFGASTAFCHEEVSDQENPKAVAENQELAEEVFKQDIQEHYLYLINESRCSYCAMADRIAYSDYKEFPKEYGGKEVQVIGVFSDLRFAETGFLIEDKIVNKIREKVVEGKKKKVEVGISVRRQLLFNSKDKGVFRFLKIGDMVEGTSTEENKVRISEDVMKRCAKERDKEMERLGIVKKTSFSKGGRR